MKFLNYNNLRCAIVNGDSSYDLACLILFYVQVSILPSVPPGLNLNNPEEQLGFIITLLVIFIFYPVYYYLFYMSQSARFIREVVVLSFASRIIAFIVSGTVAILNIWIWRMLKLEKLPFIGLIYYIIYYVVFIFLMINLKRKFKEVEDLQSK